RFRETIEALYENGTRVFVEVGPRGNMTSFMEDILRGREACAVASDARRRPSTAQLNHLVGRLVAHDVELDLDYLFAHRAAQAIDWRRPAAPDERAARTTVALSTTWPMLQLSDEAIERVHQNGAASSNGVPASAKPAASGPEPRSAISSHK